MTLSPEEKEKRNMAQLPELLRQQLSAKKLTSGQAQKKRIIAAYSSPVKLKAVVRWKERMARAGISTVKLAKVLKVPTPRLSEWLNFTWEPNDDIFHKIEKALYKLGA